MPPTVAICQLSVADLEVERNLEAVLDRVRALPERVDIACFPEYALTGFVSDGRIADASLRAGGDELDRIQELAAATDTDIFVGFAEDHGGSLHNTMAYVRATGDIARYRKRHLWADEKTALEAGDELVTLSTPLGETGLLTCYDLNFVEESVALRNETVDALLVAGAWPATHSDNWRLLLRARALDGVRWVVGAGRTGRRNVENTRVIDYTGRSLIARPDGGIHAELDTAERDLVAELDPEVLQRQRELIGIFEE